MPEIVQLRATSRISAGGAIVWAVVRAGSAPFEAFTAPMTVACGPKLRLPLDVYASLLSVKSR